jgi:hypothetical protein
LADVFISYKREDRKVAERLSSALEQLGFEVWWDFELLSGDSYRKVIRAVIDRCKAAVILWSSLSADSSFVVDEASYAQRLGKFCPARIDAVELPLGFGQIHTDDLQTWDGELSHPGFQSLVRALEDRVGRRAKLGEFARTAERQTSGAELEAFKAAEIAGTTQALQTFTTTFPQGVFSPFVRDQIETMRDDARRPKKRRPPTPDLETTSPEPGRASDQPIRNGRQSPQGPPESPASAPDTPSSAESSKSRRKFVAATAAAAAVLVSGLALLDRQRTKARADAEEVRAQADAERAASERRSRDLQEQAEAERAARQRAEQRNAQLQRERDQAERPGKDAPFDVALLNPEVRTAADDAHATAQRAERAAQKARAAARAAIALAERVRLAAPTTISGTLRLSFDGGTYAGAGTGTAPHGHGVRSWVAPSPSAGDRYAGQFDGGVRAGVAVHTYAQNSTNTTGALRYEGEFSNNRRNGVGVLVWSSGTMYAGQFTDNLRSGSGIETYPDGRRYEGKWVNGKYNDQGVLWSSDGRVLQAGVWRDGTLVRSLAK